MSARDRLIVALDVPNFEKASELVDMLAPEIDIFKVGIAPFTGYGQQILDKLKLLGKKVFLDLKVHDIPNTVRNAARAAAEKGVFMMNFHCLGGRKMLEAAIEGTREGFSGQRNEFPMLLGVTILTSMGEEELRDIGLEGKVGGRVMELAALANNAGLQGVVASAQEARVIKEKFGRGFKVITPGVRPEWAAKGDQKRVLSPKKALAEGADYLVVGRPVIGANDPLAAAKRIMEEMV